MISPLSTLRVNRSMFISWERGRKVGWVGVRKGGAEHSVAFQTPTFPEQSAAKFTSDHSLQKLCICCISCRQNIYLPLAPVGSLIPPRNLATCNDLNLRRFSTTTRCKVRILIRKISQNLVFTVHDCAGLLTVHLHPLPLSASGIWIRYWIRDRSCFGSIGIKQL